MKFDDNIIRDLFDEVYVIRTYKVMHDREEAGSLLWDLEKENIREPGEHLYQTVVRDLMIGESIFDEEGKYITFRSS